MTSADRAGNLRKHTFRRFQVWDPGTLAGTASVPGCSSVPAVGQIGQRVKAAGAGRGNLRARTARSRGFDRHHQTRVFPSQRGSTSQHRSRSRPTKLWAEHSPLRRHMTLAHWHTEVSHWHTCATEVCQTKSSRSGLKVTAHRVSARSEEVAKSWHTGTPKSHQPCCTARPRRRHVSVRACGAHSVCGSSFFFSKKKRYRCASVPDRR